MRNVRVTKLLMYIYMWGLYLNVNINYIVDILISGNYDK